MLGDDRSALMASYFPTQSFSLTSCPIFLIGT
jgi:hypothetical protein